MKERANPRHEAPLDMLFGELGTEDLHNPASSHWPKSSNRSCDTKGNNLVNETIRKKIITPAIVWSLCVCLFAGFVGLMSGDAEAIVITVDDSGIGDYASIQAALDAAEAGATIYVFSGTYFENIIVDKSVTLYGEDKGATVVDGGGAGHVFRLVADNVYLSGFGITNSGSDYSGIKIESSNNSILGNNISNNGRGVYADESIGNIIADNFMSDNSFAVWLGSSNNNTLYGNNITDNFVGIKVWTSSDNTIEGNVISSSTSEGVYVFPRSHRNIIHQNHVYDNVIGVGLEDHSSSNIIANNNASENVYGIVIGDFSNDNMVSGNDVSLNEIHGIRIQDSSDNNTVHYNNLIGNGWRGVLASQATDTCENQWDDGSKGNYWSDYGGSDLNADGIGDIPYEVSDGNNRDYNPLMAPPTNVPPVALFSVGSSSGHITESFDFDASRSMDKEDSGSILDCRWDWEGDGVWDTSFTSEKKAQHRFSSAAVYTVRLEIKDSGNLGDIASVQVRVHVDFDGDGTSDPDDTDDDNDGIPDSWEDENGLNSLNFSDANGDFDNDHLSNLEEYGIGTDPRDEDTDGDTIPDDEDPNPLVPEKKGEDSWESHWWIIFAIVSLILWIITLVLALVYRKRIRELEEESEDLSELSENNEGA